MRHRVSRKLLRPSYSHTSVLPLQQQIDAKPKLGRSNAFRLDRSKEFKADKAKKGVRKSHNRDSEVEKTGSANIPLASKKPKLKKQGKKRGKKKPT